MFAICSPKAKLSSDLECSEPARLVAWGDDSVGCNYNLWERRGGGIVGEASVSCIVACFGQQTVSFVETMNALQQQQQPLSLEVSITSGKVLGLGVRIQADAGHNQSLAHCPTNVGAIREFLHSPCTTSSITAWAIAIRKFLHEFICTSLNCDHTNHYGLSERMREASADSSLQGNV